MQMLKNQQQNFQINCEFTNTLGTVKSINDEVHILNYCLIKLSNEFPTKLSKKVLINYPKKLLNNSLKKISKALAIDSLN